MAVKVRKNRTVPRYVVKDLFESCATGDEDNLRRIISVSEFDVSKVKYDTDQTLLGVAIDFCNAPIVELLLQTVFSTEGIESELLKRAIQTNCYGVVKAVLSHISDRSTLDQCQPAYHCIAIDIAIVNLLIAEVPCYDFAPLLSHAIAARRNDVLDAIIDNGVIQTPEQVLYPTVIVDAIRAAEGDDIMVNFFLRRGAPLDVNSVELLETAAEFGCVSVLRRILDEGNFGVDDVADALNRCIEFSEEPEAVLLLAAKAITLGDPNAILDEAVSTALERGREPEALALMDEHGLQMTLASSGYEAAHNGCPRVLARVLASDTKCVGEERSKKLAWMLKSSSDPEVLRLLLGAGADIHTQYAVDECCRQLRLDSLQMLLDAGAKIMPQNPESLFWTLRMAHKHPDRHSDLVPMVRLLLDLGAPTHSPGGYWAVLRRNVSWGERLAAPIKEAVELVLRHDPALLEWRDNKGRTRLLQAMEDHDSEMTCFLTAAGADVNAQDAEGRSVLMLLPHAVGYLRSSALAHCYVRLVSQELLAAGADVHLVDAEQRTTLHWVHVCDWQYQSPGHNDTLGSLLTTVYAEHILAQPRGEEATLVRPREVGDADGAPNKKQRV